MVSPAPRILIVEDEASMLDVLHVAFTARDWRVDVATDVSDALVKFRAAPPDVLLTDKNLPGGSGVELIGLVREVDPFVGIVLMTGYGTLESARDTLNLGIDDYLEKPFDSLFGVVDAIGALRDKVIARRRQLLAPTGPLTIIVAASGARRERISALLARTDGVDDRLLHVEAAEALKPSARSERADLVVLDGRSFPEETTCLVAELKARARATTCVVLSEHLTLFDVKRLIQLEVKAIIDEPLDGVRFAEQLASAVARVRRSRYARVSAVVG